MMKIRYFNYLFNNSNGSVYTSLLDLFNKFTNPLTTEAYRFIEIADQPYYLIRCDKADNLFYLVTMSHNISQKYINKKNLDLCDLHDRMLDDELLGSITYICLDKGKPYLSVLSTLGSPRYHHLEIFVNLMVQQLGLSDKLSNFQLVEMCEVVSKQKLESMEYVVDAGFSLDKNSALFSTMQDMLNLDNDCSEEIGRFRVIIDRAPQKTLRGCLKKLIYSSESHDISSLSARCKPDPIHGALSELALDASNALSESVTHRKKMTLEEQMATKFEANSEAVRLNDEFLKNSDLKEIKV